MKLLLDTHAFLWASSDSRKLSTPARRTITRANRVYVSVVSAWELSIKRALGRIELPESPLTGIERSGFDPLALEFEHVAHLGTLQRHHGDPFDRMLVAQALAVGAALVTHDRTLAAYGVDIVWT